MHFRQHRVLRNSFWLKLAFILVEIAMAIAFIVCSYRTSKNAAAVLVSQLERLHKLWSCSLTYHQEWVVALIFTFYVFTFFIDLLPAVRTKHHSSSAPQLEMGHNGGGSHFTNGHNQSTVNGEYYVNEARPNGVQDPTISSRYHVHGPTNITKPAPAQNF